MVENGKRLAENGKNMAKRLAENGKETCRAQPTKSA